MKSGKIRREAARAHPCAPRHLHIDHVNEILTMHMGPDFILANISVDFDNAISAQQVESDIAAITRSIKQAYPQIKRIFIEAESRGNRYPPG